MGHEITVTRWENGGVTLGFPQSPGELEIQLSFREAISLQGCLARVSQGVVDIAPQVTFLWRSQHDAALYVEHSGGVQEVTLDRPAAERLRELLAFS